MSKSTEDALTKLYIILVIVGLFVALLLFVAAWATWIAGLLGIIVGTVIFCKCAYSKKTVIRNIKTRKQPDKFRSLCKAYYSVVEDGDLQMDIWLNKGVGDYVAPGDDVRPQSTYGFIRFASWPFLIRWIPAIAYVVFSVFLRVGFLICFSIAIFKYALGTLWGKIFSRRMKEEDKP